ncbi:MAG: DUF3313 domain-containing protein [Variovorax sp.]|nr:MAG: DUF3313 domain-containing protein [Variovorax sp.]
MSITDKLSAVVLAGMLGACATKIEDSGDSGFLRDYPRLQEMKTAEGQTIRGWVSPKLSPSHYVAVLLEPLVFHPAPRPTEHVSEETLQQILAYANAAVQRSISQQFRVVNRPAPGVLRIRSAITSVGARGEGLQPYQYIPVALVASIASRASTGTPQRAFVVVEVEGSDSVSGELLALRTRVGTGERLAKVAEQNIITLDSVKPLVDELAAGAFPELAMYVKPK